MNEEEIKLLNEMKENCLNGAKYVDPKAMEKYNLLRKNEDRINELYQENKQLKQRINKAIKKIESNISILNDSIEDKEKTDRIASLAYVGIRSVFYEIENALKGESNE